MLSISNDKADEIIEAGITYPELISLIKDAQDNLNNFRHERCVGNKHINKEQFVVWIAFVVSNWEKGVYKGRPRDSLGERLIARRILVELWHFMGEPEAVWEEEN